MQPIAVYLAKFKDIGLQEEFIAGEVVRVLTKLTGGKFNRENVFIKNKTVYVKTTPLMKNEIFIKKQEIIKNLSSVFGTAPPISDIR